MAVSMASSERRPASSIAPCSSTDGSKSWARARPLDAGPARPSSGRRTATHRGPGRRPRNPFPARPRRG